VAVPTSGSGNLQYTNDGGATWHLCSDGTNPIVGWGGHPFNTPSKFLTSDGAGNYYYYDHINSKFYHSNDRGHTFTLKKSSFFLGTGNYGGLIAAPSPAPAGELYYTFGQPGGAGWVYDPSFPSPINKSTDFGANWTALTGTAGNFLSAFTISFGKAKPGVSYPALFCFGAQSSSTDSLGLYRCDDIRSGSPSWTALSGLKTVQNDVIYCIAGDLAVYGDVYVGFGSNGWGYGKFT
jgi:hypothetical protein